MMYERYYGFTEKPFQVAPNPKYLYLSSKHHTALTHLEYGITEGDGFILLTGDIGTGKTLLIKKLLSGIAANLEVAVIFSTNLDAENLLNLVLNEFEIPGRFQSKAFALDALYQFLIAKFNENKRVILIIDEAQNMPAEALEEIRMMSNIQSDTHSLIQIVLVGQPELKKILATPALAALTQRIAWHYHLGPLSRAETAEYVNFRLRVAGRERELFAVDALDLIYQASGGIPRTINILCESLLVYGFADEVSLIERPLIEKVLMDRSAITALSSPTGEKPSFTPTLTEQQVNGVMERIWQLEKKISKFTDSAPQETEKIPSEDHVPQNPIPQPPPVARARSATIAQAAEERSVEDQVPCSHAPQPSPAARVHPSTAAKTDEERSVEDQVPHDPAPKLPPAVKARSSTATKTAEERFVEDQIPHSTAPQSPPVARSRPATVAKTVEERLVEDQIPRSPAPQSPPAAQTRLSTVVKTVEENSVKDQTPHSPALKPPPAAKARSSTVAQAAEERSIEDQIPHGPAPKPPPVTKTRPLTVVHAAEERSVEDQIPHIPTPQPPPAAKTRPLTIAQAAVCAMDHTGNPPASSRPSAIAKSPPEVAPAPRVPAPIPATPPAVKVGWSALALLGIIFTVWLIIPHTSQQPQRTPPVEESAGLPPDQANAPVTGTVSPPNSDVSAAADASATENTSPQKTSPLPSEAAPREGNAQPPAEATGNPAARSVPGIVAKPDPADLQHKTALSEVAEQLRSQLQIEKLRSQLQLGKKIVIHFGDDSNELQPEALPTLTALADLLISRPDARVIIQGFTDSSGVESGIRKFGEFRANMVKSFLAARGIGADKIETYALDSPRPPLPNGTESGKRFNRRVEIEVILSPSGYTSQPLKP